MSVNVRVLDNNDKSQEKEEEKNGYFRCAKMIRVCLRGHVVVVFHGGWRNLPPEHRARKTITKENKNLSGPGFNRWYASRRGSSFPFFPSVWVVVVESVDGGSRVRRLILLPLAMVVAWRLTPQQQQQQMEIEADRAARRRSFRSSSNLMTDFLAKITRRSPEDNEQVFRDTSLQLQRARGPWPKGRRGRFFIAVLWHRATPPVYGPVVCFNFSTTTDYDTCSTGRR